MDDFNKCFAIAWQAHLTRNKISKKFQVCLQLAKSVQPCAAVGARFSNSING